MEKIENKSMYKKILALILSFGPGIFAIGYTIGTGSVTSMIVAGSTYNMQSAMGFVFKLSILRDTDLCLW